MGLKNNTVYLESDFEIWKKMFEEEKDNLTNLFNQDIFSIEHVGSTAVNGLAAKPIVDIAIGINSFSDLEKYKSMLNQLYTVKENFDRNEILLIKENETETFFLIHIMLFNDKRYQDMIRFRDILNDNKKILKEYEDLKINLSNKYPMIERCIPNLKVILYKIY